MDKNTQDKTRITQKLIPQTFWRIILFALKLNWTKDMDLPITCFMVKGKQKRAKSPTIKLGLVSYVAVISLVQYFRVYTFLHEKCFHFGDQWLSCRCALIVM